MSDVGPEILPTLIYYFRNKCYHHVYKFTLDTIDMVGNEPLLSFFKGISMTMKGKSTDAIRELEKMQNQSPFNICATLALIAAHKSTKSSDREAIQSLDAKLKEERKRANEESLYHAALYLWLIDRGDKAREYIDRALKQKPDRPKLMILRGWLDLTSGNEQSMRRSYKMFDDAGAEDDIECLLGKAEYARQVGKQSRALGFINKLNVSYPKFIPALLVKAKLLLSVNDWDQANEAVQRALAIDKNNLESKKLDTLMVIGRDGDYSEGANRLAELQDDLMRSEPENVYQFCSVANAFSHMCGRNEHVLQRCVQILHRIVPGHTNDVQVLLEMGEQLYLQGEYKSAGGQFQEAAKLDETSQAALIGFVKCQLALDNLESASQQLEFMVHVQESLGTAEQSAELLYLYAVLARKQNKSSVEVNDLIIKAANLHFASLPKAPLGLEFYQVLCPELVIQMVYDYLRLVPQEPESTGKSSMMLSRAVGLLDPLIRNVPGLQEARLLLARIRYLSGDLEAAQSTLETQLAANPTSSEGHMLMAQINIALKHYKQAEQSLEQALSYNFEVRDHPKYHIVKAKIMRLTDNAEGSVKQLEQAMKLPGVKRVLDQRKAASIKKGIAVTDSDRVSVFLDLADSYRLNEQHHEATMVMQDAINEFQGGSEAYRITLSNADLAVAKGDVDTAIKMLRDVTPEQPHFVKAREKMADIYLNEKKDRHLFAACYREMVDKQPTVYTCVLLGDAYMSIQEPDKAIEVYDIALKKSPKDVSISKKIGQAMIKTHNYHKAITYYETVLKSGEQSALRYDLAELLMKLKRFEESEKVVRVVLDHDTDNELSSLVEVTKCKVLLAKIYQRTGRKDESVSALEEARAMQSKVMRRVGVEQPDQLPSQKQLASAICSELGDHAADVNRDFNRAIELYQEALQHVDELSSRLRLAKLHLADNDLDACQHMCSVLLNRDMENDEAETMLAEIMFRKNDYDQAMFHYQQMLGRNPRNFVALSHLIALLRRAGKLSEGERFIQTADKSSPRAAMEPGFHYTSGLYSWYIGKPTDALKSFNRARRDTQWGERSCCHMVEICLNPDNETMGGEALDMDDIGDSAEKLEGERAAYATAEKILAELKAMGSSNYEILRNYLLMSSKVKGNVEKALNSFLQMVTAQRDHVPAALGVATAYMLLKMTPRARNELKRISKLSWNSIDAEDFEKCWLLLGDVYIQGGKYDIAQELLKRCINYNKSCCKAYEYMGFIMEKEQSYKDAADHYEKAWGLNNRNNPTIGYKLAFNYLKAKRYCDAVDVCHAVLKSNPNYPKIRKDILDKARSCIRV